MGDVIFSNSSNDYKWYKVATVITSTSSVVSISESNVKYGIIVKGGDLNAFIPKSLLDSLGNTVSDTSYNVSYLNVYDNGGFKYYMKVPVSVTKSNGNYKISTPNNGFQGCFADATYSRPTSGWYINVYYA